MAKLKGIPGSGKGPALSRNLIYQVDRGQLKVQSWPRKRGKPKSPVTRAQNEWFRQANLLAKYAPSDDQWMSIAVAKGSPWYPRDLLMSAMRGRLFEVLVVDGQEYRAMAINEDVSSDLDFLAGTVEGSIIVRGPNLWEGLVPGGASEVLTSNGPGAVPSYQPGSAGGGRFRASTIPATSFSGSAFSTKGLPFLALENFTVHRIGTRINSTAGNTYRGYVHEIDAGLVIQAITGQTAAVPSLGTIAATYIETLSSPAVCVAGKLYVISWGRTDGTDTFALPIAGTTVGTGLPGFPIEYFTPFAGINPWVRLAKAVPAVSDTYNGGATAGFHAIADISL